MITAKVVFRFKQSELKVNQNLFKMQITGTLLVVIATLLCPATSEGQWLPAEWKKSVLPFEIKDPNSSKDSTSYVIVGTGVVFLYKDTNYIVTNKHVAAIPNLIIGINTKDPTYPLVHYPIDTMLAKTGEKEWQMSKTYDVAVTRLGLPTALFDKLDVKAIGISLFKWSKEVLKAPMSWCLDFRSILVR